MKRVIYSVVFVAALGLGADKCPGDPFTGYDCNNPPKAAGVFEVSAKDRLVGYVIVMRTPVIHGLSAPLTGNQFTVAAKAAAGGALQAHGVSVKEISVVGNKSYVFVDSLPGSTFRSLNSDPNVIMIQENAVVEINEVKSWGLDRIDQRDLPLNSTFKNRFPGNESHAYIIDTGVDCKHPSFNGRCGEGFVHETSGSSPDDGHGHGTHVAGTVAGNGYGVSSAIVHPVRVLDVNGSGSTQSVIGGISWAVEHAINNGWIDKAVINMSLGGTTQEALDQVVCDAVSAGMIVVVAAGNESQPACMHSPARSSSAITVAASDKDDSAAYFTNNGLCVDVWAPGVGITSSWPGNATRELSGTSMASPHVAGAIASCLGNEDSITCISRGTVDKIQNPGGSPNLLLYVGD